MRDVIALVATLAVLCTAPAARAGAAEEGAQAAPLMVFAGIPPLAYFVERVGGDHVKVDVLIQPGQEPHTFEPTPRQMVALSRARLYFETRMPFEKVLVEKIRGSASDLVIVCATKGIVGRWIEEHKEEPIETAGGHPEEDVDPHVWLSPPLIKIQAANIRDALASADPAHADEYKANFETFAKEIDETHERVSALLEPLRGRTIYVYHPAFGYFADAYGLKQVAVETGGKSPTPRQLGHLIEKARADGVKVIFVQPQFSSAGAKVLADAIGGAVVPLDDLAKDVLANLEIMAEKVREALEQ